MTYFDSAVFEVSNDGKSWVYENIVLKQDGVSGYIVYIKGEQKGWEKDDTITCYVPNQLALFDLLYYLLEGKQPLFSSIAEFKPLG